MSRFQTVTLELLRHGPAHNQLLSPLTRYLGLCGNHPPATVTVPFEHEHFLGRLNTLRYADSVKTRQIQLKDMAQRMAEILSEVPGFIADLSDACTAGAATTHLQLVLSASELALLPFELAYAPPGLPGAGQPLALQKQMPLSITRQVRRVSKAAFDWRRQPRILFVAAAPPAAGTIPLEAHLQVLRAAVDPWVEFYEHGDRRDRRAKLEAHLVVLLQASIESIEDLCRRESFTHVHLLAHGVKIEDGGDEGFGLALHDSRDPAKIDRVEGSRLASALRTVQPGEGESLSTPLVVSLAACDSGQVGSVVGAGASVAHALHAAGIPLVVASQFPLSFDGSVVLVRTLYRRLLEGDDPRDILADLRQQLRMQVPGSHDWASVVAYAALPADLERQLEDLRLGQASRSIDAAIDWIAKAGIEQAMALEEELRLSGRDSSEAAILDEADLQAIEARLARLREGKERLERLRRQRSGKPPSALDAEILGMMGSAEKREAQLLYQVSNLMSEEGLRHYRQRSRSALERALGHYRQGFEIDHSSHWNLVQYLSLSVILAAREPAKKDRWDFARLLAELDLEGDLRDRVAWGHGTLVELWLLEPAFASMTGGPPADDDALIWAARPAVHHAAELARIAGRESFHVFATRRQINRYLDWFFVAYPSPAVTAMVKVAEAVLEELR